MASYLVGRMIKNLGRLDSNFFNLILSRTGRVKARVLPDPVLSLAKIS
jgi:hypothetical protein